MVSLLNFIIQKFVRGRSETVVGRVLPYLKHATKIIDIGSGTGDVAILLKQQGKDVTPVDVADFHGPRFVKTTIYDGITLPFKDKSFDTALLLMVMHHTPDPHAVFLEAARVAREIIVIETSFTGPINKFFTVTSDVLGNVRLDTQWASYNTDRGWRTFFSVHGFNVIESRKYHDKNFGIIPFLHILYHLRRK